MRRDPAYLSLGSNLGDRRAFLSMALERLSQNTRIQIVRVSSLYETEPQDLLDQPWFLNGAVAILTDLTPLELLAGLQQIELEAGRQRDPSSSPGPRTLDLDLLLFGDIVLSSPTLTLPHPRMLQRRFVLEPLVEIAPTLTLPGKEYPLSYYLEQLADRPAQHVRRVST